MPYLFGTQNCTNTSVLTTAIIFWTRLPKISKILSEILSQRHCDEIKHGPN